MIDSQDEEWLGMLRVHRKGGAPKKILMEAQARLEQGQLSQGMVVKAFRTLERMNRDDLALKLVPMWQTVTRIPGAQLDLGSAFVLVNACCKRQRLKDALEICNICGVEITTHHHDGADGQDGGGTHHRYYPPSSSSIQIDKERIGTFEQAVSMVVEVILGYQGCDNFPTALSLLLAMQQMHQQEGGGMSTILVSEDDARQIMKRFLKGTCSVLFCSILLLFLLFLL
jgi:hypothetical protein